jgi:Zn-dependent peptidase ImmA (M78 family)
MFLGGRLSTTQAESLAKRVNIPFGFLFLPHPPQIKRASLPDLRQIANPEPLDDDFFDVLEDVQRKVEWFADYLRDIGAEKCEFVGRFPLRARPKAHEVAADITATLGIADTDRTRCRDYAAFFTLLADRAETAGVLVFKSGIVRSNTKRGLSVNKFRGFAISNELVPTVFINGQDADAAWIFTLVHELAHIWIGESGVSDSSLEARASEQVVERFCNRVAAEVLTPREEFVASWTDAQEAEIDSLSRRFRVSKLVIARRALDLKLLTWDDYLRAARLRPRVKDSGGDPYRTIPARNSKRFTRALLLSAMQGGTMLRDAASLLNIRPDTVVKLARRVLETPS